MFCSIILDVVENYDAIELLNLKGEHSSGLRVVLSCLGRKLVYVAEYLGGRTELRVAVSLLLGISLIKADELFANSAFMFVVCANWDVLLLGDIWFLIAGFKTPPVICVGTTGDGSLREFYHPQVYLASSYSLPLTDPLLWVSRYTDVRMLVKVILWLLLFEAA